MRRLLLLLLLALPAAVPAAIEVREFSSPEEEARYERLTEELRCPKCQNQNLADSNAPIAQDLKQRTYELLKEGKSDEEIVSWLQARYGDFITYRPPLRASTVLLWTGPFVLLLVAAVVLVLRLRRRTATGAAAASTADPAAVADILRRYEDREPRA